MRALQDAHEAAAMSARTHAVGAGILPTRRPAKLNGDNRRTDNYYSPQLELDKPDAAATPPPPTARPRPVRGRRATDKRPTAFPHPSQLTPQAPFMAQLIGQDPPPAVAGSVAETPPTAPAVSSAKPMVGVAAADLVSAQRQHYQQVDAYRKTITMATDFIIRRYHLVEDFQGLMLANSRTVEMLV